MFLMKLIRSSYTSEDNCRPIRLNTIKSCSIHLSREKKKKKTVVKVFVRPQFGYVPSFRMDIS